MPQVCPRCNERSKHGRDAYCRPCRRSYAQAWHAARRAEKPVLPWPQPEDVAWAAGLFEGEGHVSPHKVRQGDWDEFHGPWIYARFSLGTTDEDVLRRFYGVVGVGRMSGPHPVMTLDGRPQKDNWRWACSSKHGVIRLTTLLKPHLGERRLKQLDAALAADTRLGD